MLYCMSCDVVPNPETSTLRRTKGGALSANKERHLRRHTSSVTVDLIQENERREAFSLALGDYV